MAKPDLVFAGIRGSVVALDKISGSRLWEAKLGGGAFVTLLVEGSQIFAGTQGEIFCLDSATGKILWHDGLKGYGLGLMRIATPNGSTNSAAIAAEQDRQSESSSADGGVAAS